MIREIYRILKNKGYAWIDFYNSLGWATESNNINFKTEIALSIEKLIKMNDWDYPARVYRPDYLKNILEKNGFKIINIFASDVFMNTIDLNEKYSKDYKKWDIKKVKNIELYLSRKVNFFNNSKDCQFLIRK